MKRIERGFYFFLKNPFGLFLVLYLSSFVIIGQDYFTFDSIYRRNPVLEPVFKERVKHRLQIIFTQIIRGKSGEVDFKDYTFNVSDSNFYYCASLVKLPCSILALIKAKELKIPLDAIMFTDSIEPCHSMYRNDLSSTNGLPSLGQYIRRMLVTSDNQAYSRVFEFLGVDFIHEKMGDLGFPNIFIVHKFDGNCLFTDGGGSSPLSFYNDSLKLLYHQDALHPVKAYANPIGKPGLGRGYYNSKRKLVMQERDFSLYNYIALGDIHRMLKKAVMPLAFPKSDRIPLDEADRQFLLHYLTIYPRQCKSPVYPAKKYYDSYKKYFIFGDSRSEILDTNIRITNIVGQYYGFLADCAYIKNSKLKVEFFLSAVSYFNEDGILGDGKDEVESVGMPFMAELGRAFYNYEVQENRKKR